MLSSTCRDSGCNRAAIRPRWWLDNKRTRNAASAALCAKPAMTAVLSKAQQLNMSAPSVCIDRKQ